jgi:hypothetical protein
MKKRDIVQSHFLDIFKKIFKEKVEIFHRG